MLRCAAGVRCAEGIRSSERGIDVTTPINPYVAGNPVGDSPAFIGRVDIVYVTLY
jgi:hypothetical protein